MYHARTLSAFLSRNASKLCCLLLHNEKAVKRSFAITYLFYLFCEGISRVQFSHHAIKLKNRQYAVAGHDICFTM